MLIDPKIIQGCRKNKSKAQSELYKKCYAYVMGICRSYYRNESDAEAILNQSFLKVFKNIKNYKDENPFKPWLRKITVNTIIDEFRKSQVAKNAMMNPVNQESEMNDKLFSLNEGDLKMEAESILGLLNKLPDVSRKVFCLYALDGYPHKEIASLMDISEGTSKWHVNNARIKMISMMKKQERNYQKVVAK